MIIGQITEVLIALRKVSGLTQTEVKAIEESCNVLSQLPRLEESSVVIEKLASVKPLLNKE